MSRTVLDLKGMLCPLPVLRANKAMRDVSPGDELEVLATDPAAPADFKSFCDTAGHELVEQREDDGTYAIVIRKSG